MAPTINPDTAKLLAALRSRYSTIKLRVLRDAFAAAAIPGILSSGKFDVADDSRIARSAYELADALIAARGGRDSQ